ncbi:hypothetical protein CERSUDRAFT_125484 [Gelatoporia subvermispora B]|uniref:Uncharacterized protein n=1 Tax=Ceriporiopsis subvermispora (strain B) TaxID=914234 RepID=M2QQ43_CERS8|nr:hypothetical protein CERSUDRAFT_125484 [Gelatoporia subvermispora B]
MTVQEPEHLPHEYLDLVGDYLTLVDDYTPDELDGWMQLRVISWKTAQVHLVEWRTHPCLVIIEICPESFTFEDLLELDPSHCVCILRYPEFPLKFIDLTQIDYGSPEPKFPNVPFRYGREHFLADVGLQVSSELSLSHLIPLSTIFRFIQEASDGKKIWEWQDWATDTYLLRDREDLVEDVCGTKLLRVEGKDDKWHLQLYDLNQHLVRFAQCHGPDGMKERGIVHITQAFPLPPKFCCLVERTFDPQTFEADLKFVTADAYMGEGWINLKAMRPDGTINTALIF